MRVLLLGANGMAGHMMSHVWSETTSWNVVSCGRRDLEIDQAGAWKQRFERIAEELRPDAIVNAIGLVKPKTNANPVQGVRINALFPHELVELAGKARVVHLSSDCWADTDCYGRSKRAGEIDRPEHITVRTSLIGPETKSDGTGLFHWFMSQTGQANGFVNHLWDGMTTLELARQIQDLLEARPPKRGICDLRLSSPVNKFYLLRILNEVFRRGLEIVEKPTLVVDRTSTAPDMLVSKSIEDQIEDLGRWIFDHMDTYEPYYGVLSGPGHSTS